MFMFMFFIVVVIFTMTHHGCVAAQRASMFASMQGVAPPSHLEGCAAPFILEGVFGIRIGNSPLTSRWCVHHGDIVHQRGGVVALPPLAVHLEVQCALPPAFFWFQKGICQGRKHGK